VSNFVVAARRVVQSLVNLVLVTALVACGGGGGDAGGSVFAPSSPASGGPSTPTATASDLVIELDKTSVTNIDTTGVTVTVTAIDANRNAVAGVGVAFAVDRGIVTPGGTVTDTGGKQTATVTIGGSGSAVNGRVTITIVSGSITKTQSFDVVDPPASAQTPTVALALSSTTVTAGAPATATVTVKNNAGVPLSGVVVKFSTDAGLGSLSAPSALTDATGKASIVVSPAQSTSTGADTLRATVSYLGTNYSDATGFQLTATNVTISSFTSDVTTTLSAYGQANLTVQLAGTSANSAVNLSITSSCAAAGKGTITPASQTTTTGKATFTFRDGGCGATAGVENLQVSVAGTTLTQNLSITVASPTATSIGFVSASPSNIYLKGSGLVESSNITFKVKDQNNNGLPGKTVVLVANTQAGGLTLDDQPTSSTPPTVTKLTDSDGNVIVRVNSGTVPTPVRIKATLQDSSISTVSSVLSVAVGLPSQVSFSAAPATINIEGFNIQGTANTFTVIASDRLRNPVPDGTAINFVAEGGQIEASKQTAVNSSGNATATANFVSTLPPPADGRLTVVAYALGEKSFIDLNGNNVYDAGEDFQDLGDIYIDLKYDNFYDPAEDQFVSTTTGQTNACLPASSDTLQVDVTIPSRPNTCSQTWGPAYVRRAMQTIMSTSSAGPKWGTTWPGNVYGVCATQLLTTGYSNGVPTKQSFAVFGSGTIMTNLARSGVLSFAASDANTTAYNPMAAGTVITASGTDGLSVSVQGGSPVPNTATPSGVTLSYKFDATTNAGTITVSFRSPSGLVSSFSQDIVTAAPSGSPCSP